MNKNNARQKNAKCKINTNRHTTSTQCITSHSKPTHKTQSKIPLN